MKSHSTIGSHRTNAIITGIFYIVATAASIIGVLMYQPVLFNTDFLASGADHTTQVLAGAFLELLVVCAVAGTAIMLYPYLRRHNESLAIAYLGFRWFEALLLLIGLVAVLSVITIGHAQISQPNPGNIAGITITNSSLKAIHDWTMVLGPNFLLGINTFIYSLVFYRTNLVPRKLATAGLIAAIIIFAAAILEIFGVINQVSPVGALFALPIFTYELVLAVRLISKGFNQNSILLQQ